jgi:phosphonate transport system substrate-binding protein
MERPYRIGAVAYAPKVITIWEGFREHFRKQNFEIDYVLFSNYESQVEALFNEQIDIAWNSPLAWVRAQRIARARGTEVRLGPMRDTDQDLKSVLVVRSDSKFQSLGDLRGRTVGFGAIDSPQARLIPLDHMRQAGLVARGDLDGDFKVRRFDLLGGKHGDHIGGEREAAQALMTAEVDAAWMIDANYQAFTQEGLWRSGQTRILSSTGLYDHCVFTISPNASDTRSQNFADILLAMKWSDPSVRPLLELEGLKEWRPGRTSGFALLKRAVDEERFYDHDGNILESSYRY